MRNYDSLAYRLFTVRGDYAAFPIAMALSGFLPDRTSFLNEERISAFGGLILFLCPRVHLPRAPPQIKQASGRFAPVTG